MKQFKISPLMVLLLVSYMLIEGTFSPLLFLAFSLLHEGGHLLAIRALGGNVRDFRGQGQGFGLSVEGFSYRGELLAAAAGPLTSLLLGAFFGLLAVWKGSKGLWFCAFANGALAGMNLLPIMPLDGGRILRAFLAMHCEPVRARMIGNAAALTCLLPLLGLAFWQFLSSGYNVSLLFVCIYLIGLIKENGYDL